MRRLSVGLLLVALLIVAGIVTIRVSDDGKRHLTATFSKTTSLYTGAKVKVLGVNVGSVQSVEVKGTAVEVEIVYDADVKLPADVHALIVPPSIVGDRFVQLAPAYEEGPVLADGAALGLDHTGVPLELDDTYRGLDKLAASLGPRGTNKNGALSRLISAAATNLDGNGREFNAAIRDFSAAIGTLAGSSEDIAGTVDNLAEITHTFAGKDRDVRELVNNLATVSTMLNAQRGDIADSVHTLREALDAVATFTRTHRGELTRTIDGLTTVSAVLASRTDELAELADLAPVGLTSFTNLYAPRNWDPSRPGLTPVGARTGSGALRAVLFDELAVQLSYTLGAVCATLPAPQRAQLGSFCDTLRDVGGSLGALLSEATGDGGFQNLPGATSLTGILGGGQ